MIHPSTRPPSFAAVVTALLIVYVVWGSTYFAIALMIETLPPLLSAGVRYGTAGLLMLGALVAHARLRGREPIERPTGAHWRSAAIVGILLLVGGNGGVVLAELRIPSGMAAVLVATVPLWLAVFDAAVTRQRPSRLAIGGLVAGLAGVAVLLVPLEGLESLDPIGVLLVVGAAISWAAGSMIARHAPMPRSGLLATGMEMLAGGAALVLAGALLGEIGRADLSGASARSLLALAYLVVFGSIVAFTAYTWLLANVPVTTVGTYAYVNPIVAVGLGAVFLSEPITVRTLVASVVIIGAVVAMVSGRPRLAEEAGPDPEAGALDADAEAGTDRAAGSSS
ncbi:MAG TPA: EamA family transporter [Candidatus Angelobacter sp.]|nr:EamA family transporter [Candidatus Angelobacter sp.]